MRRVALALLVPVLAAACGSDGPSGPEVIGTTVPDADIVEVSATDFAFEPGNLILDGGVPVNLTFRVEDGGHNLELDDADGEPIFRFPIVEEGDAVVATVLLDEPGTYVMKCTVPGHEAAGMVAQYVVV